MKILFITSSLSSGGAERVLSTLANHWSKKGWNIDVFILSTEKKFYPLNDNIKLYHSKKHYDNSILNYTRQLLDIRKTIQKVQPTIIISFLDLMNISTLIASIGIQIPILISERNNFDTLKGKHWRILRRLSYPFSSGMVVQSSYDFKQYDYVKSKQIIANPLDEKLLLDVSLKDKEKYIIAVGSLTHQKGFDMLIEALANIEMKEWKCLILGEGEERDNLNAQIHQHQLENHVQLMGEKKEIFNYYKKASIFVLSSRYEGFPNVLNEAMAHGCTAVAFNCKTGPSEMISHEENGLIADAENIQDLTLNINKAMKNPTLRETIFYNAIKNREKNSLTKIAHQWEEYLNEIKELSCQKTSY